MKTVVLDYTDFSKSARLERRYNWLERLFGKRNQILLAHRGLNAFAWKVYSQASGERLTIDEEREVAEILHKWFFGQGIVMPQPDDPLAAMDSEFKAPTGTSNVRVHRTFIGGRLDEEDEDEDGEDYDEDEDDDREGSESDDDDDDEEADEGEDDDDDEDDETPRRKSPAPWPFPKGDLKLGTTSVKGTSSMSNPNPSSIPRQDSGVGFATDDPLTSFANINHTLRGHSYQTTVTDDESSRRCDSYSAPETSSSSSDTGSNCSAPDSN